MTTPVEQWFLDEGDKNLRINYPLTKDSIIFDIGGFDGAWGYSMHRKYDCKVYCFEPVSSSYRIAKRKENDLFKVYNYGIGGKTERVLICVADNASSVYGTEGPREDININSIDLLKINIEGGEFDLLDHIFELGWQSKVVNFQIQFHRVAKDSEERHRKIRDVLSKTHELTYDYYFVWENWKVKSF